MTKLVDTYRSHEAILRPYSELFYHGELVPRAKPTLSHVMCQWEELPKKGFPLIFHGLESEDMQEGNSPSWFNPIEALQVCLYITHSQLVNIQHNSSSLVRFSSMFKH